MSLSSIDVLLKSVAATNFQFHPKDSKLFDLGSDVADAFMRLSSSDQRAIVTALGSHCAKNLLALSGLLAEHAINMADQKWLSVAIILQIIEDFRNDYRENFRFLVLISHAASRIGASLNRIISDLLPIASAQAANDLRGFIQRDESLNRLEAYNIREEIIDGKSKFVSLPDPFSLKVKRL